MIDISFAGLLGAFIGTGIAALAYAPLVSAIERHLSGADSSDRGGIYHELPLLRRGVFAADIALFAALGYWLAAMAVNW